VHFTPGRCELETVLQIHGLSKRFPGVQALDRVDLDIRSGEIHGLIGENGAGKSTLIKIIAGAYRKDSGDIMFDNTPYNPPNPTYALNHGIAVVYQELSMCENMSIAENLFINRPPTLPFLELIDRKRLYQRTEEFLAKFDLDLSPTAKVSELALAVKEQVEILRALSYQPKLLILDEPTGPFSKPLAQRLFELMATVKAQGVSILYISHNIGEVLTNCDRVTVLRDGAKVATMGSDEIDEERLSGMMVGRKLGLMFPARATVPASVSPVLTVENLTVRGLFQDVGFQLSRGEVLGVTGLIGARRTEMALTIFGAIRRTSGRVLIDGQETDIRSPSGAMAAGIAYLPEDRRLLGLFLNFAIATNMLSNDLPKFSRYGVIDRRLLERTTQEYMEKLQIRGFGPDQVVGTLSGGNQQKTLLAKWLSRNPRILIIDEPTRGIDVGAKQAIHELIRALALQGMGVIMISSELPEVIGMSDRILVMDRGQVVSILENTDDVTEEYIMNAIMQVRRGGNHVGND
jgi:ABC-type sugar transport system ATPase subunit